MSLRRRESVTEKTLPIQEQEAKINEVRKIVGPVADKLQPFCSNESISRFLRARNWNTKKAAKMLKDTLKWRLEYRPERIRWEHIAKEAETGKIYRANYLDKAGRTVLIMRPGFQNTTGSGGQIGFLVYCMENAITHSDSDQEQMVWLIDFQKWNMSSVSMKVTRETAHVLQNRYPERLGLAVLYNPPKIFESFWTMVKPFLEPKTYKKVKLVYSNDPLSRSIMEEAFDMDKLESVFGGRNPNGFNYEEYAHRMKEDDRDKANRASLESPAPSFSGSIRSASMNSEYSCNSETYDESSSPNDEASSELSLLNVEVNEPPPKTCKNGVKKADEDKKLQTSKSV